MIEMPILHLLAGLLLCYILGIMSKMIWDGAIEAEVSRREFDKKAAEVDERIDERRKSSVFGERDKEKGK